MNAKLVSLAVALAGCAPAHAQPTAAALPALTVVQGSQTVRLPGGPDALHPLALQNSRFTLSADRVPPEVPIQVCAIADDSVVKALKPGMNFRKNACFFVGSGMAMHSLSDPREGLPLFITTPPGHNYYVSERRLDSGATSTIFVNQFEFADIAPVTQAFLTVIIDRNRDQILQENEFWNIQLTLR
ncbi:MAG: hypothetical protein V4729_02215 [Pseudomonadota bacterium]